MPTLSGLKTFKAAFDKMTEAAEQLREKLEEKQEWFDNKSDKWKESDSGSEWEEHLFAVESMLDDLDSFDTTVLDELN